LSCLSGEEGEEREEYNRHMPTDVHERPVWLAPKEVAHELRVDVASVYRAVRRGDLPAIRLSEHGALRIHRSHLDQHERTHRENP
jgi:excisionase family DNA binding protein